MLHRFLTFARTVVPMVSVSMLALSAACGGREFRTEHDAVEHFTQHRQSFERAAALFLSLKTPTLKIPEAPSAGPESPLVELARELRVSNISLVPGVAPTSEQWIEFTLAARYTMSTYGMIFVPEGHRQALAAVTSFVRSPPKAIRLVRPITDRWFYYDYE